MNLGLDEPTLIALMDTGMTLIIAGAIMFIALELCTTFPRWLRLRRQSKK